MSTIIKYPHPTLRKKSKPITKITPKIKKLAQDLINTTIPDPKEPLGVGLAAPQINISKRIFVAMMPDKKITIIINPQIIKSSKKMLSNLSKNNQFLEGCLSIPGYYGFVDRPIKIKATYQTLKGLTKTVTLKSPFSSYFQHELDHLNGVLFIDHIKKSNNQLYLADSKGHLKPTTLQGLSLKSKK
ncbi:MAG: peptide deformylase [Patescibacteria group bacterium]|nr:peptide deformylase [Patescibacteria group bacterium]